MLGHRSMIAIVLLAVALHAVGIRRSILPAQDGLKFIRVARSFQVGPWTDVVRGTDQHPLYPALVALAEPVVAVFGGHGSETWRVAAQLVAALAAVALLFPLHGLTRALFGRPVADIATLGFALLPLPMVVGHDTLSDSLALFASVLALRLGLATLRSGRWQPALGCGLVAGIGFLARPEVLVSPLAVIATGAIRWFWLARVPESETTPHPQPLSLKGRGESDSAWRLFFWFPLPFRERGRLESVPAFPVSAETPLPARAAMVPCLSMLAVAFLAVVGSYALIKGEVSEKLAMRSAAVMNSNEPKVRKAAQWLPPGLNDPRWDFSPKEESVGGPPRRGVGAVVEGLFLEWSDGLCGIFAFLAFWGLARDGHIRRLIAGDGERPDPQNLGRWLVAAYLGIFALILIRHETRMGYLSSRHTLGLVLLSLPWAAAGTFVCARGIAVVCRWSPRRSQVSGLALLIVTIAAGIHLQLKPAHPSRWGHREAGRWLATHAQPADAVLDTRGWAAFVSGQPSYDYWHVRQAFTDAHLAYVVVGDDELRADSRRAATLRAVLAYAGRPVVGFPEKKDGREVGVWVYRYQRPESWEGLLR